MPPTKPLAPKQALEARVMLISSRLYLGPGAVELADREEGWRLGGSPSASRPQYCQQLTAEPQGGSGEIKIYCHALQLARMLLCFFALCPRLK